ncbi:hypothetical protein AK812_SmicGene7402 [Symbiodinium microadriaticum]|uniref:Uncharacterized protein n=1 Tax=Symbiodinium microadriaticum TaxID=2951 RepID=A0A1Q9ENN8_SYMMI|nr:hypothetical protein AK812_SmicGene7402 [Symbiodinium microadriaticum]CAE7897379.1 unnamed protein product [Symbiodinium microadriaticum]
MLYTDEGPIQFKANFRYDWAALVTPMLASRDLVLSPPARYKCISEIRSYVPRDPIADTAPAFRNTVWQYVSDLARENGHDVSVVPAEIRATVAGLLVLSEVRDKEELVSVSLVKTERNYYLHCKVAVRIQLRDPHLIAPQMHPLLFIHNTTTTAAVSIPSTGMLRPSNFMLTDNKWMPSRGFYTRAHNYSPNIAMEQASKFGGCGPFASRVEADCVASQFIDVARARDKRCCIRASDACINGFAIFWDS